MQQHNRVKYRELPGLPGKYPYQLTPLTFEEAEIWLRTGKAPERKGVNYKMVTITVTNGATDISKVVDESGNNVDFQVEVVAPLSGAEAAATTPTSPTAPADATPSEATPTSETPASTDNGETQVEGDTAAVEGDEAKLDADTTTLGTDEKSEETGEATAAEEAAPADATADAGATEPTA